ncbi:Zn-ribbon domain-containing OB-fold protein [Streptosporangium sp. NBC_01756]|uniref:Zn-ribbon domain-containing OB-fold protein n=1 Tax=Streptosporangium sp. NBC_01756 TaxID=2975950 RepID=UPI002DD8DE65|nr:Zn-ribbon domain-containing OB-fold protein [Streptosporangium sp. NBC_01756]WSC85773.1 Zn-ribbon domain-containing OB-fold protein [Streptosporangium sp. NBC_01756]
MTVPSDEVTGPWWDGTRQARLLLQRCTACGGLQHYPRALCTACGSMDLGFTESSGRGVVDSFTVVHRSADPAVAVPYVVARVRLDEGPILLTNLVGDGEWACGRRVRVAWRPLADGRRLPVFERE